MKKTSFLKELHYKLTSPWTAPFIGYLIIVAFFGGVGVFFTLYEVKQKCWADDYKIAESLATFFIAIIATSCLDLNLSKNINRLAFLIYSFILYGVGVFLLWLTYDLKSTAAFIPAILGTLISFLVWIVSNADNEKLKEENYFIEMSGSDKGHGANWADQ